MKNYDDSTVEVDKNEYEDLKRYKKMYMILFQNNMKNLDYINCLTQAVTNIRSSIENSFMESEDLFIRTYPKRIIRVAE